MNENEKAVVCTAVNAPWLFKNHMGIVILRLGVGIMMLTHGIPKLMLLLEGKGADWLNPLGIGPTLSLALSCFAELGCSCAIIVGFLTRLASLVLIINFWVIVFVVDAAAPWNNMELAVLYLIIYASLLCSGAGHYSIDHLLRRKCCCKLPDAP